MRDRKRRELPEQMENQLLKKAMEALEKYQMVEQGNRIAVGVSGGADSVALLDFLCTLRETYQWELLVCHLNHCLRGEESLRDEAFVRSLAQKYHLEFRLKRAEVAAEAACRGQSVEETGRELRYAFFRDCAGEDGKIATAHTRSDSMETLLLNLARGTGVKGLRGIPPVRGAIIRPLITCTRQEILAYNHGRGLDFVTDSSNEGDDYRRNQVRHHLIPQLEALNPSLSDAMAGLMARMEDQWQMTEDLATTARRELACGAGLDRQGLLKLPKPVGDLLLQQLVQEAGGRWSASLAELTRQAAHSGTGGVTVGTGLSFRATSARVWVEKAPPPVQDFSLTLDLATASFPVRVAFSPGRTLEIAQLSLENGIYAEKINKTVLKNSADCDRMKRIVVLRRKQDGDRLAPWYRAGGTHPLKKLYQEAHIPPEQRGTMAVLADEEGILWAQRVGTDRRVAVGAQTTNAIIIQVVEDIQDDEQL